MDREQHRHREPEQTGQQCLVLRGRPRQAPYPIRHGLPRRASRERNLLLGPCPMLAGLTDVAAPRRAQQISWLDVVGVEVSPPVRSLQPQGVSRAQPMDVAQALR
jgi:hypothetical protein